MYAVLRDVYRNVDGVMVKRNDAIICDTLTQARAIARNSVEPLPDQRHTYRNIRLCRVKLLDE